MTTPNSRHRVRRLERTANAGRCPTCKQTLHTDDVPDDVTRIHEGLKRFMEDRETPEWLAAEADRLLAKRDTILLDQAQQELDAERDG